MKKKPSTKRKPRPVAKLKKLPKLPAAPVRDRTTAITKGINLVTALGGLVLAGWNYRQKLTGRR